MKAYFSAKHAITKEEYMSSIYGTNFQYEGDSYTVLKEVCINKAYCNCSWFLDNLWIEGEQADASTLLGQKWYTSEELSSVIGCLGNSFIYFARMRCYPIPNIIDSIVSFKDFLQSQCKLIVLITDFRFFEIYTKNMDELLLLNNTFLTTLSINAKVYCREKMTRTRLTL